MSFRQVYYPVTDTCYFGTTRTKHACQGLHFQPQVWRGKKVALRVMPLSEGVPCGKVFMDLPHDAAFLRELAGRLYLMADEIECG